MKINEAEIRFHLQNDINTNCISILLLESQLTSSGSWRVGGVYNKLLRDNLTTFVDLLSGINNCSFRLDKLSCHVVEDVNNEDKVASKISKLCQYSEIFNRWEIYWILNFFVYLSWVVEIEIYWVHWFQLRTLWFCETYVIPDNLTRITTSMKTWKWVENFFFR